MRRSGRGLGPAVMAGLGRDREDRPRHTEPPCRRCDLAGGGAGPGGARGRVGAGRGGAGRACDVGRDRGDRSRHAEPACHRCDLGAWRSRGGRGRVVGGHHAGCPHGGGPAVAGGPGGRSGRASYVRGGRRDRRGPAPRRGPSVARARPRRRSAGSAGAGPPAPAATRRPYRSRSSRSSDVGLHPPLQTVELGVGADGHGRRQPLTHDHTSTSTRAASVLCPAVGAASAGRSPAGPRGRSALGAPAVPHGQPARVDAVGRDQPLQVGPEVGGGVAELPATVVAVDDGGVQAVVTAEHVGGPGDVALGEAGAHPAGRPAAALRRLDVLQGDDLEVVPARRARAASTSPRSSCARTGRRSR